MSGKASEHDIVVNQTNADSHHDIFEHREAR
jgi:hypothetical protein